MLGKKIVSFKKLAKKVKQANKLGSYTDISYQSSSPPPHDQQYNESLLRPFDQDHDHHDQEEQQGYCEGNSPMKTPTGFLAVYVGEERRRFVVPTSFLSHPLFKMLLEKAYNEFGFQQRSGLAVPCSVATFQEVVSAVQCTNGTRFDFGKLVEDFL